MSKWVCENIWLSLHRRVFCYANVCLWTVVRLCAECVCVQCVSMLWGQPLCPDGINTPLCHNWSVAWFQHCFVIHPARPIHFFLLLANSTTELEKCVSLLTHAASKSEARETWQWEKVKIKCNVAAMLAISILAWNTAYQEAKRR